MPSKQNANSLTGSTHATNAAAANPTSGGDAPSAKQLVLASLQSSAGIARLTTQAGNVHEVAALALLTGSSDVLGKGAADIASASIGGITLASTWGALVTAIANS